jgi:hypothetical protein
MVRVSAAEAGAAKPRVPRAAVAARAKTNLRMSSLLHSWEANAAILASFRFSEISAYLSRERED